MSTIVNSIWKGGAHYKTHDQLPAHIRKHAKFAYIAYDEDNSYLDGYSLDQGLSTKQFRVYVNATDTEVILAVRGSWLLVNDWGYNDAMGIAIGRDHWQIRQARELYEQILEKHPHATVVTTGHSLGGATAAKLASENNIKGYSYNPGSSPLGSDTLEQAFGHPKVTTTIVQGDPVSVSMRNYSNDLHVLTGTGCIAGCHSMVHMAPPEVFEEGARNSADVWNKTLVDMQQLDKRAKSFGLSVSRRYGEMLDMLKPAPGERKPSGTLGRFVYTYEQAQEQLEREISVQREHAATNFFRYYAHEHGLDGAALIRKTEELRGKFMQTYQGDWEDFDERFVQNRLKLLSGGEVIGLNLSRVAPENRMFMHEYMDQHGYVDLSETPITDHPGYVDQGGEPLNMQARLDRSGSKQVRALM